MMTSEFDVITETPIFPDHQGEGKESEVVNVYIKIRNLKLIH